MSMRAGVFVKEATDGWTLGRGRSSKTTGEPIIERTNRPAPQP